VQEPGAAASPGERDGGSGGEHPLDRAMQRLRVAVATTPVVCLLFRWGAQGPCFKE
jgi:hypothetical protein